MRKLYVLIHNHAHSDWEGGGIRDGLGRRVLTFSWFVLSTRGGAVIIVGRMRPKYGRLDYDREGNPHSAHSPIE